MKARERSPSSTELKSEVTSYNGTFKWMGRNENMVHIMSWKSENFLKSTFFCPDKKNLTATLSSQKDYSTVITLAIMGI